MTGYFSTIVKLSNISNDTAAEISYPPQEKTLFLQDWLQHAIVVTARLHYVQSCAYYSIIYLCKYILALSRILNSQLIMCQHWHENSQRSFLCMSLTEQLESKLKFFRFDESSQSIFSYGAQLQLSSLWTCTLYYKSLLVCILSLQAAVNLMYNYKVDLVGTGNCSIIN